MLHKSILTFFLITLFTALTYGQKSLQQLSQEKAIQWMEERSNAEVLALKLNMPFRLDKADGSTIELKRFKNGRFEYYKTDNLNAAKTIQTNRLWPGGNGGLFLGGSGETLAVWDAGRVRPTHREMTGRLISPQGATNHQHSTHVAGTMIASGITANAKGMAYQAKLRSYDWAADESEMAAAAAAGYRVSNHSYGLVTGWDFDPFGDGFWYWFGDTSISPVEDYSFGYYDESAKSWDDIATAAPNYLMVVSAGNDRGDGPSGNIQHKVFVAGAWRTVTGSRPVDGGTDGFDCIGGTSISKNVLTVGSINDIPNGYQTPAGVGLASYTAWGPTDDGRIKPDVVANGQSVFSTLESSDSAYGNLSGTSMATPSVAGSIGLMMQQQKNMVGSNLMRSSKIKAIIIQTANEAGPANGPDYKHGWGVANIFEAVQLMRKDSIDGYESHILDRLLTDGSVIEIPLSSNGLQPLRATICWTDPSGTVVTPALDPPDQILVNDLDLRIIRNVDRVESFPWILDPAFPNNAATTGDNTRDNVEQINITSPAKGTYTLRISHKGTLSGGSQYVSIVVTGNSPIGPLAAFESDTAKVYMIPNDSAQHTFRLFNNGDSSLTYTASGVSTSWFNLGSDSGSVGYNDSAMILLNINTLGLPQWSTFTTSFSLETNDPANPSKNIPLVLYTQGPLISGVPGSISIEAETSEVKYDTIMLANAGYTPLDFSLSNEPSGIPDWLTISDISGTLAPGDSIPIALTFSSMAKPPGDYTTTFVFTTNDSLTGTVYVTVNFHVATRRTVTFNANPKWNLISVPIQPFSLDKNTLFPSSISNAFYFSGGYFSQSLLETGKGYWLKFDSAVGYDIDGYLLLEDSIDVTIGWNLIGSISSPVSVSNITSDPPGIVTSEFFGYQSGYQTRNVITPGEGYWVNANQNGKLILSSEPAVLANTIRIVPSIALPPSPPDGGQISATPEIPTAFSLEQNYPNPFNPTTSFGFQIAEPGFVTLKIYTILGEEVATLVNEHLEPGTYSKNFDASGMPSGVYTYRLTEGMNTAVKKMLLLK